MDEDEDEDVQAKSAPTASAPELDLSALVVPLLKGVIYREAAVNLWSALYGLQFRVRDYVAVLGLELVLDEAEGYAFLRSRTPLADDADDASAAPLPRLITRRPLGLMVSLLLALLRKKLAEFDASGGETRLILSRDQIVEMTRVFLPDNSNESRVVDQIEMHLGKIVDLGFLRKLKPAAGAPSGQAPSFEVRRILKAFVDAQWLAEFDGKLESYRVQLHVGIDGVADD